MKKMVSKVLVMTVLGFILAGCYSTSCNRPVINPQEEKKATQQADDEKPAQDEAAQEKPAA